MEAGRPPLLPPGYKSPRISRMGPSVWQFLCVCAVTVRHSTVTARSGARSAVCVILSCCERGHMRAKVATATGFDVNRRREGASLSSLPL